MRAEHINPFVASLKNAFQTMLACEARRGELTLKSSHRAEHYVSGVIGLSGLAVGTVVVSLSKEVALKVASTMLGDEATEINDDVLDAVGELANVVAGAAVGVGMQVLPSLTSLIATNHPEEARVIIIVEPTQTRIFVRKPAGFWLASRSRPMIPPRAMARTSFMTTSMISMGTLQLPLI